MASIGIRELRQYASKYVARVEAGEELDVTKNGRVVARLVPISPAAKSRQSLIDSGVVIPARNPRTQPPMSRDLLGRDQRSLSDVLAEMRDEE